MDSIRNINISLEIFGGFLSLVIILSLIVTQNEKSRVNRRYIFLLVTNSLLLFSDAAALIFKGRTGQFSYYAVLIANFLVFILGYILLAVFTDYLVCYISTKASISKSIVRVVWGMCCVAVLLVVLSQWNHMYYVVDENNFYQRQEWFWLSQLWGILCMAVDAYLIFRYRKSLSRKDILALSSYIILPVIAMSVQIFIYGIALLNLATSLSVLCIYMGIQMEQAKQSRERERELEKSRTELMLSQIHPHFLFNSLTSISALCRSDPKQAEKVVSDFACFLRGNIESIGAAGPVPFSQELAHVTHYLEIEKVRYRERLRICYDIQPDDFLVPSLAIQPIVENAIRYGAGKRAEGGTVTLSTRETAQDHRILVVDDGNGFDPARIMEDGRTHIGIQNVKKRLQQQCGGDLKIDSVIGHGTTVTLIIPKEWDKHLQ